MVAVLGDPNSRVWERDDFLKVFGGPKWWHGFQDLVLLLDAYAGVEGQVNMQGDESSERAVCTRCSGTGWEGQEPCPWCANPPEVGMFRQVRPADAKREITYLVQFVQGWKRDREADLVRGIEVRERTRKGKCPACEGKITVGWVACPHCGEGLAA